MSEITPFPAHLTKAAQEGGDFSLAADGIESSLDVIHAAEGTGDIDFKSPAVQELIRQSKARRQFHPSGSAEATAQLFRGTAEPVASIIFLPRAEL